MCQQQYDGICRLDTRHRKSSRSSEYFQDQPFMYERFRKEKIVEEKIQRLRNVTGMMDTIVTFQNGAWHARHAGCYCNVSRWRRFGADTPINILFSRFLAHGTCTGRPRTHRITNDTIRKRLLRRPNCMNNINEGGIGLHERYTFRN